MPIDISTFSAQEQATLVYVAYYDRAPDPAGLQFYGQLIAAGTITAAQAATDFSGAAETKLKYPYFDTPDVATASTFITSVYANLFGRAPDAAGLDFWTDALVNGKVPVGEIILEIAAGAQGDDIAVVTNKIEVGLEWAKTAADAGVGTSINSIAAEVDGEFVVYDADAFSSATTVLDGVDATAASVAAAKATTASYFADAINAGETFNLTTGQDDIQIDTFGTVDTVRGIMNDDGMTDDDTFSSGDIIDGNGLTEVRITLVDGTTPDFVEMEGVNSLEFRGAGETGPVTFDASSYGSDLNNFMLSGGDNADVRVNDVEFDEGALTFTIAEGTTGDLDVDGTVGDWSLTADLSATGSGNASVISDIGGAGINAYAGEDADVRFDAEVDVSETGGADAVIDGVNIGDVTLMVDGDDASVDVTVTLTADATSSGAASVGDVTFGNINMTAIGDSADASFTGGRYANADNADATIGNQIVGDVSINVDGYQADVSLEFTATASATGVGNASVGDTTFGDINMTAGDDGEMTFDVRTAARVDTGDATIGNLTLGDISVVGGLDNDSHDFDIDRDARVNVSGNALVGDILVGAINGVIGDVTSEASQEFTFANDARAFGTVGDATVGNITLGDITFDVGSQLTVQISVSNSAFASKGDATVGNVTVGAIDLIQSSGSDFDLDMSVDADASASGNAIVGDVTIGSITSVMDLDTTLDISLDVTASGTGTMTSIGNVTIGDVTLSGPVAIGADADLDVSVDSDGTIGAVTVGDVDVDFLSDSTFTYDVGVFADGDVGAVNLGAVDVVADSIDYEVSVSGDNLLGGIGIGDIMLAGDDIYWSSIYLYASGDIGDVNVGNIMIDAATNLNVDDGIYISAVGDVGNVTIGDISIMTAEAESGTFDVFVYAGDNVGDVTIGNLESSVSNTDFQYDVTVSGGADVGDITVGSINLTANGLTSNASATIDLSFDAASGDSLGNVTIGDINLAGKGGSTSHGWQSAEFTIGGDASDVGDILIGNVNVVGTAVNKAADADGVDDYAGGYVGIYADTGSDVSSLIVGDVDFTLTNGVDAATGWTSAEKYNVAYATLSVTSDSAVTVGNINLTAVDNGAFDVVDGAASADALFDFNIIINANGGAEAVTIGDITVVGGAVDDGGDAIDDLSNLASVMDITASSLTVGDIDYSGYTSDATIDVFGIKGAANISAAAGDTEITVNTSQNLITLGDGDDTVIYEADEDSGTTYAEIDKISGFESGSDLIDFSADGDITNVEVAGAFADYDSFLVAAQNVMSFNSSIDVFVGNDGTNTYVAIESDDDTSNTIDYVIELSGITSVTANDLIA
jgi:hypothetical protein